MSSIKRVVLILKIVKRFNQNESRSHHYDVAVSQVLRRVISTVLEHALAEPGGAEASRAAPPAEPGADDAAPAEPAGPRAWAACCVVRAVKVRPRPA